VEYEVRRIVTGHDDEGRAIVRADSVLRSHEVAPGYDALEIWCTNALPAVNDEDARADGAPGAKGSRALLRFGVLEPGHVSPMHRSESLDYGLCLEGECELRLDDGEVVTVRAGDVVVQRGTNHAWANVSDRPVRFAWVLVDAEPVRVNGEPLPEAMPEGHDVLADWRTEG
jgi:quercetin dioxygenase-like cupin family protein